MFDSVRPHRRQPNRLPHPWDSPGKNNGVGCHFLLQCMKEKSLSRVCLLVTPWTSAYQAPPSMGFSRQECWSGVPLPSPSLSLDQGILKGGNCALVIFEFDVIFRTQYCCSGAKLCLILCHLMNCNPSGFPVPHSLLEFAQIYIH